MKNVFVCLLVLVVSVASLAKSAVRKPQQVVGNIGDKELNENIPLDKIHQISCDLVKGEIENTFITPHEPISIGVGKTSYSNAKFLKNGKLSVLDINTISLNLAGDRLTLATQGITNDQVQLYNGNQQALFFVKQIDSKKIEGLLVGINLEKGDRFVQYNVRCNY